MDLWETAPEVRGDSMDVSDFGWKVLGSLPKPLKLWHCPREVWKYEWYFYAGLLRHFIALLCSNPSSSFHFFPWKPKNPQPPPHSAAEGASPSLNSLPPSLSGHASLLAVLPNLPGPSVLALSSNQMIFPYMSISLLPNSFKTAQKSFSRGAFIKLILPYISQSPPSAFSFPNVTYISYGKLPILPTHYIYYLTSLTEYPYIWVFCLVLCCISCT